MEEDKTNTEAQPAPGAVISPQSNNAPSAKTENIISNVTPLQAQETPITPAVVQQNQAVIEDSTPQSLISSDDSFSWTGPEFAQQDKPSSWYVTFILVALVLGGGIYLLTKDAISSIVVAFAIIVLVFYGLRKPKDITYTLNDYGVTIGPKSFTYEEFRSFTATVEGVYLTVTFLPLRRFATTAGLYYQGNDEEKIVNFLSDRLPMEKHKPDIIDSLMQRMRF